MKWSDAQLKRAISASQISCFLDCQLRYFIEHIMRIRSEPSCPMMAGTITHAVGERLGNKYCQDPYIIDEIDIVSEVDAVLRDYADNKSEDMTDAEVSILQEVLSSVRWGKVIANGSYNIFNKLK